MSFYESIVIIRQDVSTTEVDKIATDMKNIIESDGGKVHKTEYWGLRSLAYEIQNNKKGHYYLIKIETNNETLKELDRKIKLSESIIRHSLIKVEGISKESSPILREKNEEEGKTIDVTAN